MIFTIKMHKKWFSIIKMYWKWLLPSECVRNDFYYKNSLQMIFTIKMHCVRNDFYYKNSLEMIFTIKMH